MKCIASVPPKYKDYIEYQPDMGFIQPGASFEMGIKFRPQHELVKAASPFCLEDSDVVAIPLKLKCPDQKLPVWYTLKARLTSGDINFSAKTFEFGNCYVGEGLSASDAHEHLVTAAEVRLRATEERSRRAARRGKNRDTPPEGVQISASDLQASHRPSARVTLGLQDDDEHDL